MHSRFSAHVFVFVFTSSGLEHAHLEVNYAHIDVAYVSHAKIDARYIAANCSCVLLKLRSDMSHINSDTASQGCNYYIYL